MVRLAKLLILILLPTVLNAEVHSKEQWVSFYLRDCKGLSEKYACRQHFEKSLGRMIAYRGLVIKEFESKGIPPWFATLALIESAYKDDAKSNKGALGLFQLMPYNIKKYRTRKITKFGREIEVVPTDDKIEQYGFNPVSNTQIAAEHLSFLYERFLHDGDTEKLVVMAYNGGRRRINLWLAGKGQLPEETQNYWNKYQAIQHILENAKLYRIKPVKHTKFFIWEHLKDLVSIESDEDREETHRVIVMIFG